MQMSRICAMIEISCIKALSARERGRYHGRKNGTIKFYKAKAQEVLLS